MMSQTSVKTGAQEGRFPSLSALKNANNELLKMRRESSYSSEFLNKIKEFVKLAQATGAVLNVDTERWAGQSLLDYWSNYLYRAGIKLDEHEDALANFDPKLAPTIPDSLCPYVGLAAFREEAHDKFFGRQKLVEEMCKQLSGRRFLAVLGPSGSGKSSLVMAGLVPALKAGAISADSDTPGSKGWRYCQRIVPGTDPLLNLAMLVRSATTSDPNWAKAQTQAFMQDAGHLLRLINEAGSVPAFILVDQFEEIFTLTSDEAVRTAFTNNLLKVVEFPDVRHTVVITMRSDFEEYITKIGKLQELYAASNIRVTPLSAAELREAIVQPAEPIGLKFEDGIVDQLVHEVLGEPGGLPLLQFTLRKLWDSRRQNLVTWDAFHELVSCREALTRAADQVYNELSPPDQERAKRIFLKLVRPSTGAASTAGVEIFYTGVEVFNNRLPRAQLYIAGEVHTHIDQVLAKFLDAGLLRETETDVPGEAKIEVAHEALIRHWKTLNSWLIEARVKIGDRLRFADAAKLWDKRHRDPSVLLSGTLLEAAQRFEDLTPLEQEFIKKSAYRQRGWKLVGLVALLIAAAFLAFLYLAFKFRGEKIKAEAESKRAMVAEHLASSRGLAALASSYNRRGRLDLALLLSLNALNLSDSAEARGNLLEALGQYPHLVTYLHGHDSPSTELSFDKDGSMLFSLNQDGTINAWSAATYKPLSSIGKRIEQAQSMALSPDHQKLAVSIQDKNDVAHVALIDPTSGQEIRKFELKQASGELFFPSDMLFSPDGQVLAGYISAGRNEIIIWDVNTGKRMQEFIVDKEGFNEATCMAFSTDGKLLAAGTDENYVLVWNLKGKLITKITGKGPQIIETVSSSEDLATPTGFYGNITSLAFQPRANKYLAVGSSESITFWDINKSQKPLGGSKQQTRSSSPAMAFSADGKFLAVGSANNSIAVWNTSAETPDSWGRNPTRLAGHSSSVVALAFDPTDGTKLASGDSNKNVILWDIKNSWRLATPLSISQSAGNTEPKDGRTGDSSMPVLLLPLIALSPDGHILASLTYANSLALWDVPARQPYGKEPLAPPQQLPQYPVLRLPAPSSIALSPDNKTVATSRGMPWVILWDISAGKSWYLPNFKSAGNVSALAFNPNGAILAIATENDWAIQLWDMATNRPLRPLNGHKKRVTSMVFRSDGKILATGSQDGSVILWDVDAGRQIKQLPSEGESGAVNLKGIESVAWSRDNRMLACGDRDSMITVWDATDPLNVKQQYTQFLTQHERAVVSLAFSPDNTTLASGGYDGTIYLWDVRARRLLGPLRIAEGTLRVTVIFAPDGQTLISNANAFNVLLWDLSLDRWKSEACKLANRPLREDEWRQSMGEDVPYQPTCP